MSKTEPKTIYTLHIHKLATSPHLVLKDDVLVYAKVTVQDNPSKETLVVNYTNAEWDEYFTLACMLSSSIKIEVNQKQFFGFDPCVGKASIRADELLRKCGDDLDYPLDLYKGKKMKTGTIWIQFKLKPPSALTVSEMRQNMTSLQARMKATAIDKSGKLEESRVMSGAETMKEISEEANGLSALESLRSRLGKLKLENLQPIVGMIDEVSKIHPYAEAAWNVVSALYKIYQKKVQIEKDIVNLVGKMNGTLLFVEDVEVLETKLKNFTDTIESVLKEIEECSELIRGYMSANTPGQTWKAFSESKQIRDYGETFEDRTKELDSHVGIFTAVKVSAVYQEVKEIKDIISRPTRSKQSVLVIPPLPTDLFSGRGDELKKMKRCFEFPKTSIELQKQRRIVLYGTGGMGKTQMALQFLKENSDKFTTGRQYIIDASSEDTIANSFASIGADLNIENANISKVLTRLSQTKEDWLLIYDNADNPKLYLLNFFPKSAHGNIIVTTRNASLGSLSPKCCIEVLMLGEETAVHLLLESSQLEHTEENTDNAQILVKEFGCLALAIVQAGSYIASRGVTLVEYLDMYRQSSDTLLRIPLEQNIEYQYPVFVTWEISYAELTDMAKMVLNICSFLYREAIAEDVFRLAVTSSEVTEALRSGWEAHDWEHANETPSSSLRNMLEGLRYMNGRWNKLQFAELTNNLCSCSLLRRLSSGVYSIHPLVHEWARDRLEKSYRDRVQQDVWLLLYYSTQSTDDKEISVSRMLLPHISSCGRPTDITIKEAFADVYTTCGRWAEAEKLQVEVLEARKQLLGPDHPSTLNSMANLAWTYWNQGRWAEAEKLDVEVLEARKQLQGPGHPNTLNSMANLASTYRNQGRWAEAEKLEVEVLEARKQVLGHDHPDTLNSMANLAETYRYQGRWAEAEKLEVEVLEARKQLLGPDHPHTLISMDNLASTYWDQGRWAEAEKLQVEVLEAMKRLMGPDHPDTLISMGNLASTYRNQGRWAEAEKLEVEVLEARKQLLGPDHPDTLTSMANLASTYWNQGRLAEAEKLEVEVLEARKQVLGPNHPSTLLSMANLAPTYGNQGRWAEAEKLQVEVLEARKQLLGPDHPDTLTSMTNLAETLRSQGQLNEASALLSPAVESSKRVLGLGHLHTIQRSRNLISMYRELGRLDEAGSLEASLPVHFDDSSAPSSSSSGPDSDAE